MYEKGELLDSPLFIQFLVIYEVFSTSTSTGIRREA